MRFLLILGLLLGLCFLVFKRCSAPDDEPKKGFLSSAVGKAMGGVKTGVKMPDGAESGGIFKANRSTLPAGVQVDERTGGFVSEAAVKSYRFEMREPPSSIWWQENIRSEQVAVAVDSDSRTCVFVGPLLLVTQLVRMAEALDVASDGCDLRAWMLFVSESNARGFDLVAELGLFKGTASVTGAVDGGAFKLDWPIDRLRLQIELLADSGRVEVLQSPYVRLTDGQEARVETTKEIPVPVTTVAEGVVRTGIEYRKAGLQLGVTPRFLGERRIRLKVDSSNGLVGETVEVEGSDVATFNTETVSTAVELAIGETVALGGVRSFEESTEVGIFKNKTERRRGTMYVILSTYQAEPRARPVTAPAVAQGEWTREQMEVPGAGILEGLGHPLLPPIDWKAEERNFLRTYQGSEESGRDVGAATAERSAAAPAPEDCASRSGPRFSRARRK